jgi:hypothetical protein
LPDDVNTIPIFRNNLVKAIVNDNTRVMILIDTGASVTAISSKFLQILRQNGHICTVYKAPNIDLNSVSGNKLDILGQVYLRVRIAQFVLRIPVYVISNMQNLFILGNDTLAKYRMVINYETKRLYVKSFTDIFAVNTVIIPPNQHLQLCCRVKHPLTNGTVGRIDQKPNLNKAGLCAVVKTVTAERGNYLNYTIKNNSDQSVTIDNNTKIGRFYPVYKKFKLRRARRSKQKFDNTCTVLDKCMDDDYDFEVPECITNYFKPIVEINCVTQSSALQVDFSQTKLKDNDKNNLIQILNTNRDVFSTGPYDLGELKQPELQIKLLPGAKPFKHRPYRASPKQREIIDKQVDELLKAGIIEPCSGNYSSPVVLVDKHDDTGKVTSQRLCIDLRQLNSQIQDNNYPMPLISDFFDSLGGARYFSVIDCAQGYHQIKVAEDSRDLTAFVTHSGLWRYARMPFGIKIAPAFFTAILNDLFRKLLYKGVIIYIDDILIYSTSVSRHFELLQEVFDILRKANLKIKASKCKFAVEKVKYLGFVISAEGLQCDPVKLKVVQEYEVPKNLKTLRSWLGLTNYFRRFIPNYSRIAKPLIALLSTKETFVWTKDCQAAFELLKEKLLTPPIVAFPNYNAPYLLYTDASGCALSGILSQIQETEAGPAERVIAYTARNMKPAEARYSTHEREMLAIFHSMAQFKCYIQYSHVDIITDCKALCEIMEKKPVSARLGRWSYFMNQFSYTMHYRSGAKNHADGLSRIKHKSTPQAEDGEPPIGPFMSAIVNLDDHLQLPLPASLTDRQPHAELPLMHNDPTATVCAAIQQATTSTAVQTDVSNEENTVVIGDSETDNNSQQAYGEVVTLDLIKTEQSLDRNLKPIIDYLQSSTLPKDDKLARNIVLQSPYYSFTDNLLYHHQKQRNRNTDNQYTQIVIPENLRLPILQQYHDNLGHRGAPNVYNLIVKKYFWINMFKDCYDHVHSCHTCMRHKKPKKKDRSPLTPIPVFDHPFMNWFVDIAGPFRETANNNKYIFTCVDSFSKWVEIIPLPNYTSYTLARALFERIICRFGSFKVLTSDRGTSLISTMFDHLVHMCGSQHIKSASFHHQSLGQVEVMNQIVDRMLAKLVNDEQTNWDSHLPIIQLAHNISTATATGYSPFLIIHGREVLLPLDISVQQPDKLNPNARQELADLIERVTKLDKLVKQNIDSSKLQMKAYYDVNSTPVDYQIGDLVWLYVFVHPKHLGGKLKCSWTGPFRIIGSEGKNYNLRRVSDNVELPLPINVDRLQKVYDKKIRPPIPQITPTMLSTEQETAISDALTVAEADLQRNSNATDESDASKPTVIAPPAATVNQAIRAPTPTPTAPQAPDLDAGSAHAAPELPKPDDIVAVDRAVYSIPKARTEKGVTEYYIIYDDQPNKSTGVYVPEPNLTPTEKLFIDQHKDEIRFMRKANKVFPDMYAIFNGISDIFSPPTYNPIIRV